MSVSPYSPALGLLQRELDHFIVDLADQAVPYRIGGEGRKAGKSGGFL
jgi:hypothetical protein